MTWQVVSGELDVLTELRKVPAQRVRRMQEVIGRYAHRMHYALSDTPGDAVELLLASLEQPRPKEGTPLSESALVRRLY